MSARSASAGAGAWSIAAVRWPTSWSSPRRSLAAHGRRLGAYGTHERLAQELGFSDPRPDLRRIGSRRPELLLVAEKASLKGYVNKAQAEFGCSTLILGGLPSLLSSEYCARALQEAGVQEVTALRLHRGSRSGQAPSAFWPAL